MKRIILYGIAVLLGTSLLSSLKNNPGAIHSQDSDDEPILAYDEGNSYYLDEEGRVMISYNNDENIAEAPLILSPSGSNFESGVTIDEAGFYITMDKTAITYGGFNGDAVQMLVSEDMGKSWNTYTVTGEKRGAAKHVVFTTKSDGWIVMSNFYGMGHEEHYIYKTADGGKTWTEVDGNANEVYARVLTGAGFANDDIGFLSFRYETDFQPAICRTKDGGLTWEKLYISLPSEYNGYGKTPLSPVFSGKNGIYPILLSRDGVSDVVGTIYLKSNDYGMTWVYDEMYGE